MLKTEFLQGDKLIRTYSDDPCMGLLQTDTGIKYSEAVDIYPCSHAYEEVPMDIPQEEDNSQQEFEALVEAYNRGVNDA